MNYAFDIEKFPSPPDGYSYFVKDDLDDEAQAAVEASNVFPFPTRPRRLYLDMDGVLADFDKAADETLGMESNKFEFKYGTEEFWRRLNQNPLFFSSIEPMPDAYLLWREVRHLDPVVLTALPKGEKGMSVNAQKRVWIKNHFGGGVEVITCRGHEKPDYCQLGDILIDDRNINEKAWKANGGIFIHHLNAASTLVALKALDVL